MTGAHANLAEVVLGAGVTDPDRTALAICDPAGGADRVATFAALRRRADALRSGLVQAGLREGDRVAALVPVSVDLYALSLAAMLEGITIVLLDGRLSPARFVRALRAARPRAVVGVPGVLRRWPFVPPLWRARRYAWGAPVPGAAPFEALVAEPCAEPARAGGDRPAIVAFTSGTGGAIAAVERSHAVLLAQHAALRAEWPEGAGEVHLTAFPTAALHALACGATAVLPPVDLRAPGAGDPARLASAVRAFRVTRLTVPPALLARLAEHLRRTGERLPSVHLVGAGGGPVPRRLGAAVAEVLPGARAFAIYGSSEAEPIAVAPMEEVALAEGEGFLAGRPAAAAEVALVDGTAPVADGAIGEIAVRGAHVARGRDAPREVDGAPSRPGRWCFTGDLARRDAAGRLWLAGRAGDDVIRRGRLLRPFFVEARALEAPGVRGAALVAHRAAPEGELALELEPGDGGAALAAVRRALAGTAGADLPLRPVAAIPTDARHASKVDRRALRRLLEAAA